MKRTAPATKITHISPVRTRPPNGQPRPSQDGGYRLRLVSDDLAFDPRSATFLPAPAPGLPLTVFPPHIEAKAQILADELAARLRDADNSLAVSLTRPDGIGPLCQWYLMTYGPVPLTGDAFGQPCDRLVSGQTALIVGISWADSRSAVPARRYLAGKPYHAGFQSINRSALEPGPAGRFSGRFSADGIHLFPWLFVPKTEHARPARFEVTFYVDLAISGLDESAIASWHWDARSTWRHGSFNSFLVTQRRI